MFSNKQLQPLLVYIGRIGVSLTFIGHGYFAFVQRANWANYLMTVGFDLEEAMGLMQVIGIIDFIVALLCLFYPFKWLFLYCFLWATATALIRPISGEHFMEFVERGSNITLPLILFLYYNQSKKKGT